MNKENTLTDVDIAEDELDLFAEELPPTTEHGLPPCSLSSVSSASCTGPACLTTFYCYGTC